MCIRDRNLYRCPLPTISKTILVGQHRILKNKKRLSTSNFMYLIVSNNHSASFYVSSRRFASSPPPLLIVKLTSRAIIKLVMLDLCWMLLFSKIIFIPPTRYTEGSWKLTSKNTICSCHVWNFKFKSTSNSHFPLLSFHFIFLTALISMNCKRFQ